MDKNFEKYQREYLDLLDGTFPGDLYIDDWEIEHRKKILKDWLDNELKKTKEIMIHDKHQNRFRIVKESLYEDNYLGEVLRSEDEWADREIAKYRGEENLEAEPETEMPDYDNNDEFDNTDWEEMKIQKQNKFEDKDDEEEEHYRLISFISALEEHIWENGNNQQIQNWHDYKESVGNLKNLSNEELEKIFTRAAAIVNTLRGTNFN